MKAILPITLAAAALVFTACDARVNTNPPATESNTTVVNPPGEKKTETNTTVVAPQAPAEKKTETNTTVTPGGGAVQQKTETTR